VLDAQDIVFVMRTPTRKIFNEALGVGSRLPAWATAMGRVMLAALPPEELDHRLPAALLNANGGPGGAAASANSPTAGGISAAPGVAFPSPPPAYGHLQASASVSSTPRSADELRAALEQVRQQGWCLLERELEEGLVTLAVPIQGRQGRVIASIALHAQTSRTSPQLLLEQGLPKLQETAQSLSRLLQIKG
jgi:IclR family pca regulon transcriptional regulator